MNKEQLIKGLVIIIIVIFGSSILIRTLTSGQTLADYAVENKIPIHSEATEETTEDIQDTKSDSK